MALQPSDGHGKRAASRALAYAPIVKRPSPVAAALRGLARLLLAIPVAIAALLLSVAAIALGAGIGVYLGFVYFAETWTGP